MDHQTFVVGTSVAVTVGLLAGIGSRALRKREAALDAEAFMRCPVGDDFALQLVLAVKQLPDAPAVDALIRSGDLDSVGASVQWFIQRLGVDAERKCGAFFDHSSSVLLPVFDPQTMGLALPAPARYHAYVSDGHRYTATIYDLDEKSGRFLVGWLELNANTETASASPVIHGEIRDGHQATDDSSHKRDPLRPDRHTSYSSSLNEDQHTGGFSSDASVNREAVKRRPLWQMIAAFYALAIFACAAGVRFGALVFGWSLGLGN